MANISDNVDSGHKGKLKDFNHLQSDNLKFPHGRQYVKESLLKRGFSKPFAMCKIDKKLYILDGFFRKDIILELKDEGHKIPVNFSYYLVDVNNDRKKAIEILLEVYSSKERAINEDEFNIFIEVEDIEIDTSNLNIDVEIDIDENFNPDDFFEENKAPQDNEGKQKIILEYSDKEYEKIQALFKQIGGSKENIVYESLFN